MTATTQPVIRDAKLEDAPAMLAVIEAAYDEWPPVDIGVGALEHLRWKMSPPGDELVHHAVVLVDDHVAATQLRWACQMRVGGEVRLGETGADLAVHPDFRGQGLARMISDRDDFRLNDEALTGFGMQSNAPEVRHLNENRIARELTTWTLPLTLRAQLGVHRAAGALGTLAPALWGRIRRQRPQLPSGLRVEVVEEFDQRTDAVWEAARGAFDVIPFRNSEYLNWRDRLLGYVSVRGDGTQARVLDLVADPGVAGIGANLLDRAAADLREAGCRTVECLQPRGHREERALRDSGFLLTRAGRVLQVTKTRHAQVPAILEVMADHNSPIHVMAGDLDHG